MADDAERLPKGQAEPDELRANPSEQPGDVLLPENIGGLLRLAYRKYEQLALSRLEALGFDDIRLTHLQLLPFLLLGARRTSEIAVLANITKQAAGQLANELEAFGYIKRVPDPDDRRAKRIQFTERGQEMARNVPEIISDSEKFLEQIVGHQEFAAFKNTIKMMVTAGPAAGLPQWPE